MDVGEKLERCMRQGPMYIFMIYVYVACYTQFVIPRTDSMLCRFQQVTL